MREITKTMIIDYGIDKLNYDFMGYTLKKGDIYTFHHLIIPKRLCSTLNIPEKGYIKSNGAILCGESSHRYLHIIEIYDRMRFEFITDEMIDMNVRGELLKPNLIQIDDALKEFESLNGNLTNCKGGKLIRSKYLQRNHFK